MFRQRLEARKKGQAFTMVELLVVLVIVGILAAVATPLYLQNAKRAKASEAVSTMSTIRQAEREYKVSHTGYYNIIAGSVGSPPPNGAELDPAVTQYFSNDSYDVDASAGRDFTAPDSVVGDPTTPVDFLITADGSLSTACTSGDTDCAVHNTDVSLYRLEMDNSGRTLISYNGTAGPWSHY